MELLGCLSRRVEVILQQIPNRTAEEAYDMENLKKTLEEKVTRLQELVKARSKAFCTSVNSSADEVKRETEIDELEQDIKAIEAKLGK
jgi:gas vesicle protein